LLLYSCSSLRPAGVADVFLTFFSPSEKHWGNILKQVTTTFFHIFFYYFFFSFFLCWLLQATFEFYPPHSWGFEITHTDTTQSIGLLWASDQPVAETSTWQTHNTHNRQTSMPPAGFEPAIPAGERLQTHALDRSATGIGFLLLLLLENYSTTSSWIKITLMKCFLR
jgi:hypothetical protein